MFTPNRSRSSASGVSARRSVTSLTPWSSAYKSSQRTSLLRRSLAPTAIRSPAVSNTSSILGGSPNTTQYFGSNVHSIQSYASSLPVSITECITLAEDVQNLSVQVSSSGWAWLIDGNILFVWSLKLTGVLRSSICREVKLPSTNDSAFNSDLISVAGGENVTVVAVSTMGKVLIWGNVFTSTSYNEGALDINTQNETCYKVVTLGSENGFIVVTTAGTLFHVSLNRGAVVCVHLHTAKGMLARLGRRMSSFIFTPQQNPTVVQMLSNRHDLEITILTTSTLQQWRSKVTASNMTSCELKHEVDLQSGLLEKVSQEIWKTTKPSLQMWPLDVQLATRRHHLAVLLAVTDSSEQPPSILHYVVCVLSDLEDLGRSEVFVLEHTGLYDKNNEGSELSYKLVVETSTNRTLQHFSVYSDQLLILKSVFPNKNNAREDSVPFNSQGDSLLACGEVEGSYVFLSAVNGLLTCTTSHHSNLPPAFESSILSNAASPITPDRSKDYDSLPGTPQVTQARMAQLEASENDTQRLQAAFLHFCRKNSTQAQSLIDESFKNADSSLDDAVAMMSRDILDDFPASDPRWAESLPYDQAGDQSPGGGSLILFHQLEDKHSAHKLFINFLNEIGIWEKLTFYNHGREKKFTKWLVHEHAEKLCSTIGLLQQHSNHQGIVDAAIKRVLTFRGNVVNIGMLSHKDYFYREVSKVEEIVEYLFEEEEKCLQSSQLTSRDRIHLIAGVNSILEAMLTCAKQYRKSHPSVSDNLNSVSQEFKPWTIGKGRINIRSILVQQNKLITERGIPECEDNQQRFDLLRSLVTLTDLVLDDYSLQLDSNSESRWSEVNIEFEKVRTQLISPLLELKQVDQCSFLAEKYKDFDILVQLCNQQNDNEKMLCYMDQFSDQGFSEHLFKWYLRNKEYKKLLDCCGGNVERQNELSTFLKSHPKLAWMHQIRTGNYMGACESLAYLAGIEEDSLSKKKVYLSLGKLSAAFSGAQREEKEEKIKDVNQHHNLLKYQESLPFDLLEYHQVDNKLVIPATELIKMYVGHGNLNSSEHNFKKAFEIIDFIDLGPRTDDDADMDSDSKSWWNLYIWCQAILRDAWQDIDPTSDPFVTCSHTVLFKVLKLAHETNSLEDILPDVDDLLNRDELDSISQNPSLEYFIRASFERVKRTLLTS